jgi:hypothetical protein
MNLLGLEHDWGRYIKSFGHIFSRQRIDRSNRHDDISDWPSGRYQRSDADYMISGDAPGVDTGVNFLSGWHAHHQGDHASCWG